MEKRIRELEKRVAALERQLQGQPTLSRDDLDKIERELARRIALGIARK